MTCFVVMLVSNIFSNFSNTFKTCQTTHGLNVSKTIPLGRVTLLNIACSEMSFCILATPLFRQCMAFSLTYGLRYNILVELNET